MINKYEKILRLELIPAMGCTEPIALAYAAAHCKNLLGANPSRIELYVSGSIIKNVKSVIVPGTGGLKGIGASVAAGIVTGDITKKLEILSGTSSADKININRYLEETDIKVNHLDDGCLFDILVVGYSGTDTAKIRISDYHTNIVLKEKNSENMLLGGEDEKVSEVTIDAPLNIDEIWTYATECDIHSVEDLLELQITHNMAIALEGLNGTYGANIGKIMLEANGTGVENRAAALAAAASDARMNGCEMPVIINSGSGNQGITCSVPVIAFANELGSSKEQLMRALLLSNLLTIHQKHGIGRLSAFCGAVCAGASAGAGIAFLKGGSKRDVLHTLVNALAIVSGMVCDGAKSSCAAKIAFSVKAGLMGWDMASRGQQFYGGDGIIKKGAENTIKNICRLGREGMCETNNVIIDIMIE